MNNTMRSIGLSLVTGCCFGWAAAGAQQAAHAPQPVTGATTATAQSEAGEPRADTSAAPTPLAPASPPPTAESGRRAAAPTAARLDGKAPGTAVPRSAAKTTGGADRLDLGTATVTGDREQPKVMYIVPWKKSEMGDLAGKPMNSLVDEILAPVDRDVFKREVYYYRAVKTDSQNGASGPQPQQGEK